MRSHLVPVALAAYLLAGAAAVSGTGARGQESAAQPTRTELREQKTTVKRQRQKAKRLVKRMRDKAKRAVRRYQSQGVR